MSVLGATLRNARLAKGVTTSQAAQVTRIKVQTLESIESDDFSSIAAPIYCKGFIKIYAEYLGLDPVPLIEEYKAQNGHPPAPTLGNDTAGVIEHTEPDTEAAEQDSTAKAWPMFELPKLNIFRRISLPSEPARIKAMIADEPVKFALVGIGVVVVLVFIVSGVVQFVRPHSTDHEGQPKAWDKSVLSKELPAPYVDIAN